MGHRPFSIQIPLETDTEIKPVFIMTLSTSAWLYKESCTPPEGEESILLKSFIAASPFPHNWLCVITKASSKHTLFTHEHVCMREVEELLWILVSFSTLLEVNSSRREGCLQHTSCSPSEFNLTSKSRQLGLKPAVSENLVGIIDLVIWFLKPSL